MTTKRHLVMLAFMVLALCLSFTTGSVVTSAGCDPSDCDPSDCATACQVMSAEECAKVCPPECIVLCDEPCAGAKQASADCAPGCDLSACAMGSQASGTLTGIDPAGILSFNLASGQSTDIMK
jgi:hypothetical protein